MSDFAKWMVFIAGVVVVVCLIVFAFMNGDKILPKDNNIYLTSSKCDNYGNVVSLYHTEPYAKSTVTTDSSGNNTASTAMVEKTYTVNVWYEDEYDDFIVSVNTSKENFDRVSIGDKVFFNRDVDCYNVIEIKK